MPQKLIVKSDIWFVVKNDIMLPIFMKNLIKRKIELKHIITFQV